MSRLMLVPDVCCSCMCLCGLRISAWRHKRSFSARFCSFGASFRLFLPPFCWFQPKKKTPNFKKCPVDGQELRFLWAGAACSCMCLCVLHDKHKRTQQQPSTWRVVDGCGDFRKMCYMLHVCELLSCWGARAKHPS